jgi:hypothetical protein
VTTSRQKAVGSEGERAVARIVGGRRVGQDGGPVDVIVDGYLALQVKRTKGQPSLDACAAMIEKMGWRPELRGVVAINRPGGGRRARRLVVFDLAEWAEWHGFSTARGAFSDSQGGVGGELDQDP